MTCRATSSPFRRFVAWILLCSVTSAQACLSDGPITDVSYDRGTPLDGETIFRGVFFGAAPVGLLLPEVWKGKSAEARAPTPEIALRVRNAQDAAITRIRGSDPGFLDGFARAVQSGNHLVVQDALTDAAQRLTQALAGDPEHSWLVSAPSLQDADELVEVETVLIVIVAAVAVAVVVLFLFAVEAEANSSPLQRDVFVDLVTTRLAL